MEDISWESVQKWWFTNNNGDLAIKHVDLFKKKYNVVPHRYNGKHN